MDKQSFKKAVLRDAIKRQQEIIDDFKSRIDYLKSDKVEEDELHSDNQELIESYNQELDFVIEEMDLLRNLNVEGAFDVVRLGAVVETDQMKFFPSVSIEKFTSDGEELFGISEKAPIYSEMKGKAKGEIFHFGEHTYKIVDLY